MNEGVAEVEEEEEEEVVVAAEAVLLELPALLPELDAAVGLLDESTPGLDGTVALAVIMVVAVALVVFAEMNDPP